MQPAVDDRPLGERRIAPIARHHQLTLDEYLAVVADPHLRILQRRTDRVHLETRLGPVAADHRRGFGLAVALEQGEAERMEEDADLRIERRPARNHRLDPARSEERRVGKACVSTWSSRG